MNKIEKPEWNDNSVSLVLVMEDVVGQLIDNQNEIIEQLDKQKERITNHLICWHEPIKKRIAEIEKQLDRHDMQLGNMQSYMQDIDDAVQRHDEQIEGVKEEQADIVAAIDHTKNGPVRKKQPEPGYWWCPLHGVRPHKGRCGFEFVDRGEELKCNLFVKRRTDEPGLCPICGGEISIHEAGPEYRAWVGCDHCKWEWFGESIEQWRRIVTRGS